MDLTLILQYIGWLLAVAAVTFALGRLKRALLRLAERLSATLGAA